MSYFLVPVDFSQEAENAMRYAAALAKHRNAKVKLIHVYPIPLTVPDMPSEIILTEQIMLDARERLDTLVDGLQGSDVAVETAAVAGTPGTEILYEAEQTHPALIAIGTHGGSPKKNRWVGSNALHVIDRAEVPVLAVPESATFKPWKRVCCATDFDYHEISAIKELSTWIQAFDADLILVHVNNGSTQENDNSTAPAYRESFIEKVREVTGIASIQYEYIATNLNLVDELREFAVFHNADVLVMLHRVQKGMSRFWHNSLTKEMSKDLPIALLSFPVAPLEMEEPKS